MLKFLSTRNVYMRNKSRSLTIYKIQVKLTLIYNSFKKNFFNVYLLLRDRDRVQRRTQNPEQAPGPKLWTVSTEHDMELKPTSREIMIWAEVRHLTEWTTQAPQIYNSWERKRVEIGEGQREKGTEDPKQALCWHQRARRGAWPHELWDHDLS